MSGCEPCGGTGYLIGASYEYKDNPPDAADNIARCDTCQKYWGDKEAMLELCAMQPHGSWAVWATDLNGFLTSTEDSHMYLRSSPGDAASLQLWLLNLSINDDEPEVPQWIVHVLFVPEKEG